jgi:NitT/TauT family transport system substrate-binding protein
VGIRPAYGQSTAIRIGTTLNEGSGPVFYGVDQGIFARLGLNVEAIVLQNGAAVGAALAGGSLEVGTSSTFVFMNAWRHNLPYVIVAPGVLYRADDPNQISGLAVARDSSIARARDLNGKIIAGITVGALDNLATLEWMDENGGDSKSIKFVETSSSSMADAIEAGRVSAALIVEPQLTAAGDRVRVIGRPYSSIAKSYMLSVWFANTDWATKNASTVRLLNDALNQSAAWAVANPENAAAILEKWTKLKLARPSLQFARRLDANLVQPVCDAALKYKMIDTQLDARKFLWSATG